MKRSLLVSSLACTLLGGCWYKSFSLDPSLDPGGTGGMGGTTSNGGEGGSPNGMGGDVPSGLAATNDVFAIDQGASLTMGNVLTNDVGTALTVSSFDDADPSRPGSIDATTLEIAADGTINFVPNPDFFGPYRVSYSIKDASGKAATGNLVINVRPKNIKLSLIASGYGGFAIDGATEDELGKSIARVGDVNQDGVADFIVGAPRTSATGYAAIVYGKSSPTSFATSDPSLTGKATLLTGAFLGQAGFSVSGAGDQNADGTPDVVIGSPGAVEGAQVPGEAGTGAVYVVYGKSALGTNLDLTTLTAGSGYRLGGWLSAQIGKVVAGGSDLNGDGKPDLVLSGNHSVSLEDNAGSFSVIFGPGAAGSAASQQDLKLNGFNSSGRVDKDIAMLGDIDGDSRDDVGVIGFQDTLVLLGLNPATDTPAAWPATPVAMSLGATVFGYKIGEGGSAAQIGGVGDFNKDGTSDIVYCATASSCTFLVGKTDLSLTTSWVINGLTSAPRVDGNGDLNGDGFADFVLADATRAYVVLGREAVPTTALSVLSLTKNEYVVEAEPSTSIAEVAVLGDVNDDGRDDFAVGVPARASKAGRVYVVFGQ